MSVEEVQPPLEQQSTRGKRTREDEEVQQQSTRGKRSREYNLLREKADSLLVAASNAKDAADEAAALAALADKAADEAALAAKAADADAAGKGVYACSTRNCRETDVYVAMQRAGSRGSAQQYFPEARCTTCQHSYVTLGKYPMIMDKAEQAAQAAEDARAAKAAWAALAALAAEAVAAAEEAAQAAQAAQAE